MTLEDKSDLFVIWGYLRQHCIQWLLMKMETLRAGQTIRVDQQQYNNTSHLPFASASGSSGVSS